MKTNENKVERDIGAWRKQEEQIIKLFPPSVVNSREFQLEKLHRLDAIYHANARVGTQEERLVLQMLNIERKKLEKQLFPKIWQRLLRNIQGNKKIKIAGRQTDQERVHNEQSTKDALAKTGFGGINWQRIEQKMQQGDGSFSVSQTQQVTQDKRMEYELSFSKDLTGRYKFDQYQAILKSDTHPDQIKKQTFFVDAANSTTAAQAFNLLEGRAVQQEYINARGGKETIWAKLDFNDKDSQGNFKRREFHSGMDPEKALDALPIREKANAAEMEKLLHGLRNGERVPVTLMKEGKEIPVLLEVNPSLKTFDLYNAQGKKVTLLDAVGEKKEKAQVVSLPQRQEQKQSLNTGLSVY